MVQQLSGLSTQRGASVTSIVFIIIALGVAVKLIVAIVPAQIGDYQLTKTLSAQLQESNNKKETAKQFVERVARPRRGFDHEAAVIDGQADLHTGRQVKDIEQRWRNRQHDRAADLAQIRCVHDESLNKVIFKYNIH